jgi:(2Fe-2S) ferredoxin
MSTIYSEPYYQKHIFFCDNHRPDGSESCGGYKAREGFEHCKSLVRKADLAGVRVNRVGCLNRCSAGPIAVVYPEAVWYTYVDNSDIDEIVSSHLGAGQVVARLVTTPGAGR